MSATHEQHLLHERRDPHRRNGALSNVILGGQDGVVNVLGVLLGVAAASGSPRIVLAAGLATAFAESVSMAAVAYTSTVADADVYASERAREYRHVRALPEVEREEVRAIFAKKGFEGDLLERVVETITRDPNVWVALMMSEEHRLEPVDRGQAWRAAFVVGVSALVGALIPVAPFFWLSIKIASWVAFAVSAMALFAVGAYKARVTSGRAFRSGAEMTLIGVACALAGYAIGALFQAPS